MENLKAVRRKISMILIQLLGATKVLSRIYALSLSHADSLTMICLTRGRA